MFVAVGVLAPMAGVFHLVTHAFFKAVLFLTCGAIMHGFGGQLDLRKLSGLRKMPGWRVVSWTMFYACLCLVGFPYISSGFYSKDKIMAEAFVAHDGQVPYGFFWLGVIAVATALLTAYYTFRVWFRVCAGPTHYEMGDEHHGDDHGDDDHGHHDKPHAPKWAINVTLVVITAFAAVAIIPNYTGWVKHLIEDSTAVGGVPAAHHGADFWADPHRWMPLVASVTTLLGLAIAWWLHLANRSAADRLKSALLSNPATGWLPRAMERKWYVDEIYDAILRTPLWLTGKAMAVIDRYLVDMTVVDGIGRTPRAFGRIFQPLHNGLLQSYAVTMAGGVALIAILVLYVPDLLAWIQGWMGGAG
jgi:NADH-quinone oxidoreductase subunit L